MAMERLQRKALALLFNTFNLFPKFIIISIIMTSVEECADLIECLFVDF